MKTALYARVSTSDQNAETQLASLRRYCEVRNWTIVREFVDVASGATADRPELARMMQAESLRQVDCVMVWKFDRLFRSVEHMMEALNHFAKFGVHFVSMTECIDTSTPAGKMVFTMLAAVAAFERDLVIERTKAGMERARRQGRRIGRPTVKVDPAELRRLREVEHLSIRQIEARLGNISRSKIQILLRDAVPKLADRLSGRI